MISEPIVAVAKTVHPLKALFPIGVLAFEIVSVVNFVHDSKALVPIFVTVPGIVIFVIAVDLNASFPIDLILVPKEMVAKTVHPLNALLLIVAAELENVTVVIFTHDSKALVPIFVTFVGIVADVNTEHPLNA